jgi:cell division septation protein DedD
MPRNTEGEFEMILGNKQVLSLFFLVVVLFGVFFSLGYIVGRSGGPSPVAAAQPAAREAGPAAQEARSSPAPAGAETPAARVEPVVKFEREGQPGSSADSSAAADPAPALVVRDIHLQLAAVRVREDAEALVETLRKKGYRVHLNSDTRDGWHRVIIGPFPDERTAAEMKAKLEQDGYKSLLKKP